jgi:hypothetical protein
MSNAVLYYFAPIVLGVIFVIIGYALFRQFARGSREGAENKHGVGTGCAGFALMLVGATVALAIVITSPMPSERQRIIERALRTPAEEIERIIVLPGGVSTEKPLLRTPVVIDNPQQLRQFADILAQAKPANPDHPRVRWTAHVDLMTKTDTRTFAVTATEDDRDGTLLYIGSRPHGDGWQLGVFRVDGLEKLLESASIGARAKR